MDSTGLIRREKRSSIVIYSVTGMGSNFLTGSEGALFGSGVWRLHEAKYPAHEQTARPGNSAKGC
jgi:hypothetical protein